MEDQESSPLLPKYYLKSEKMALIRSRLKSLVVHVYSRMLLTFVASTFCTTILIWVNITTTADIPLYCMFLPVWIGHVIAIGIYFYLFRVLYTFCQVHVPSKGSGKNKKKRARLSFKVDPELIPVLQSFVVVGSWLMLGTALLVCSEVLLFFKLKEIGHLTYTWVSFPLLVGSLIYFFQAILCKGQTAIASVLWILLFIRLLGVDLELDHVFPPMVGALASFAPFGMLLVVLIYIFARLLIFHQLGIIFLSPTQLYAANGYLIGFILSGAVGGIFASCDYGQSCSHIKVIIMGALTLVVEVFFFGSVYQITRKQVQLSFSQAPRHSTPLPLSQTPSGEWDIDRSQGHFSVILIGIVKFDTTKTLLSRAGCGHGFLNCCCCASGFEAHDEETIDV